jgi:hypothetical protein
MQAGKARLHFQSAMTAESHSSKINELHISVQNSVFSTVPRESHRISL